VLVGKGISIVGVVVSAAGGVYGGGGSSINTD
jgi:hypothetical protein